MSLIVVEDGMEGLKEDETWTSWEWPRHGKFDTTICTYRKKTFLARKCGFLNLVNNLPQERLSIAVTGTASAQLNWTVEYVTERGIRSEGVLLPEHSFECSRDETELDLAWVFVDRQIQALNEGDLTAEDT